MESQPGPSNQKNVKLNEKEEESKTSNPDNQNKNYSEKNNSRKNNSGKNHQRKDNTIFKDVIIITGYPKDTLEKELYKAFAEFGEMHDDRLYRFNFQESIVNYMTFNAAKKAILSMNGFEFKPGAKLSVRFGKPADLKRKQYFEKSKEKEEIVAPQVLQLTGNFENQMEQIMLSVRLTREEVENMSSLYVDVATTLQYNWPGCRAIPFGSITTGLGIKSSDADCFVEIPPSCQRPGSTYVNQAKKALQSCPQIFTEVLAIPSANTPIVKFHHLPTRTNCDVSFKTPLGVRNSTLIAFFLRMDSRLIPLNILIKYWAKIHNLSGCGKLSNYAITMLMVFYLQQGPQPILPSIGFLQRDAQFNFFIDGWNTGFNFNFKLVTSNTATVAELFIGFFEFYSTFAFKNLVVCPLLGRPIETKAFLNPKTLPDTFQVYKILLRDYGALPLRINNCMCVQDPFQLNRNIASAVGERLGYEIQEHFKWVVNIHKNCVTSGIPDDFLRLILVTKPTIQRSCDTPQYKVMVKNKLLDKIQDSNWVATARETMRMIFEDFLCFECVRTVTETENLDEETINAKGFYRTWHRKPSRKKVDSTLEFVEREKKITEDILANTPMYCEDHPTRPPIVVSGVIQYVKSPREIILILNYVSGLNISYKDLCNSLMEFVHLTFFNTTVRSNGCSKTDEPAKVEQKLNVEAQSKADQLTKIIEKLANVENESSDEDITDPPAKVEKKINGEGDSNAIHDCNIQHESSPEQIECDKADTVTVTDEVS